MPLFTYDMKGAYHYINIFPNKVRLRTRELFSCISAGASWNAPFTDAAISVLEYWKFNVVSLNSTGKRLKKSFRHVWVTIFLMLAL